MPLIDRVKKLIPRNLTIRLGSYALQLTFGRVVNASENQPNLLTALTLRQALYLRKKYSFLADMSIIPSLSNAEDVLRCYLEIVPVLDESAREVSIRNALSKLKRRTSERKLAEQATRDIARSDLRSGIPDRARMLAADAEHGTVLQEQLTLSDRAYGADLLTQEWPDISRGQSLCYYFQSHPHLVRGKRVLHFSPEAELRQWMRENATSLNVSYETSNIVGDDVDMHQDLTAMNLEVKYDLLICHRVLEHVADDETAFQELHRILAPGGILQISVPQSMHRKNTTEWILPDETHHDHVRQYGQDFAKRLAAAGFDVTEESWLIQKSRQDLLSHNAYPLRMYHATKPT